MTDSKMDLVIGPNEAVDDALYGTKASYGAYVLLKNLERTEELNALSARLPEFQEMLPGDPAHRAFVPGDESNIFSCNVLYCSGYSRRNWAPAPSSSTTSSARSSTAPSSRWA